MFICSSCGSKLTKDQAYYRDELFLRKRGKLINIDKGKRPICKRCLETE